MENVKTIDACMITPKGEARIVKLTSIEDVIQDGKRQAVLACYINGCAIYRELSGG